MSVTERGPNWKEIRLDKMQFGFVLGRITAVIFAVRQLQKLSK